jgi:exopolysaccharide biosynthesis protein
MKRIFLLCWLLSLSTGLFAQIDSTAIANAHWTTKRIAEGVTWKSFRFSHNELFNANQSINLIIFRAGAKNARLIVAHSDSLETTSQQAQNHKALVGINGSYFTMRGKDPDDHADLKSVPKLERSKLDHNRSVVYLRDNGQLVSKNNPGKSTVRQRHQQAAIVITDSTVDIVKTDTLNFNWEDHIKARHIMTSGPLMLLAGNNERIPNDAFCNNRHPRTAVGKKADGTILLFVVDGRFSQSAGMSIPELQKTLRWLGCVDAINLDGGGSSTMYIKDEPDKGIVNYPSDNKKFDHEGEREVANTLLLITNK